MRGTIQKKGKKWYAVVYDGVSPETGKYRRRWVPAGTRRADAERMLAELVQRSHQGKTVAPGRQLVGGPRLGDAAGLSPVAGVGGLGDVASHELTSHREIERGAHDEGEPVS